MCLTGGMVKVWFGTDGVDTAGRSGRETVATETSAVLATFLIVPMVAADVV